MDPRSLPYPYILTCESFHHLSNSNKAVRLVSEGGPVSCVPGVRVQDPVPLVPMELDHSIEAHNLADGTDGVRSAETHVPMPEQPARGAAALATCGYINCSATGQRHETVTQGWTSREAGQRDCGGPGSAAAPSGRIDGGWAPAAHSRRPALAVFAFAVSRDWRSCRPPHRLIKAAQVLAAELYLPLLLSPPSFLPSFLLPHHNQTPAALFLPT
ncbi:hypothetical protein BDY21DRAFT_190103 [Lineolata rhizophorae]|uniref:Uncharacterized protein n=1 Tax=Lineolata rhizophorae TaxID=578093 RepID=A0A6A6P6A9_9PEZI|nr:hypothetical protein BDY21DRAFT_190103 [Lineolata rhizophorae]